MTDELDLLRSFRPEATGPSDALQLRERTALMETIVHAPTGAPRTPRLRRPRTLLLGLVLGLAAAVGAAGATGIIPNDVQQALGFAASHGRDASLTPEIDQAVEQTSAPTVDGGTLELWTAPTAGGGTCAYLRQLDAAGAPTDSGPTSCVVTIAGGGSMGEVIGKSEVSGQAGSRPAAQMTIGGEGADGVSAQVEVDASGAATVFGQAPSSVANVEVVDAAGAVLTTGAPQNGWFVLALPASAVSAAASILAQSSSGTTVGTLPITTTAPPVPSSNGTSGGTQGTTGTDPA